MNAHLSASFSTGCWWASTGSSGRWIGAISRFYTRASNPRPLSTLQAAKHARITQHVYATARVPRADTRTHHTRKFSVIARYTHARRRKLDYWWAQYCLAALLPSSNDCFEQVNNLTQLKANAENKQVGVALLVGGGQSPQSDGVVLAALPSGESSASESNESLAWVPGVSPTFSKRIPTASNGRLDRRRWQQKHRGGKCSSHPTPAPPG
jgi:hypothetical protein